MNNEEQKKEDMQEDVRMEHIRKTARSNKSMNEMHDMQKEESIEKNDFVPTGEIIDSPIF